MSKISEADRSRHVKEQKLFHYTMKTEHGESTFKMLDELARERLKATLGVEGEVFDSFSLKTKEKIYQNLRQEYENRMKDGSKVLNQEVKNPEVISALNALNEKLGK
jgi:membrane peptidoglycan carboxypeptidase